ncbi:MAG: hypothetical protein ACI8TQ_000893 [Planctomycetota bacterium]|jgi:hypothetical protein
MNEICVDKLWEDVEFFVVIPSVVEMDFEARGVLCITPKNSPQSPRVFKAFSTGCKHVEGAAKRLALELLDPPRR